MIRTGRKYSLEEVFAKLPEYVKNGEEIGKVRIRENFDGDEIKVTSQRLQTFYLKGTKCCECGLEADYFVKEKASPNEQHYHFNLYGVNEQGEEILFTKDHQVPKSKGGKNHISNYQTMCKKCNEDKGDKLKDEKKKFNRE